MNSKFIPDTVSFARYMKQIIDLIWNNGTPIEVTIGEIGDRVGRPAYSNHRKLSHPPWDLLEDVSGNRTHRLTKRGVAFAQGNLKITRKIIRDPLSWKWVPASDTNRVHITDFEDRIRTMYEPCSLG